MLMPHYWSTSKKSIKLEQWSPMDEAEFIKLQKDYYAAITGLDDQFARIYAYLKEHNLFDDTIVVLTADHGEMLTSHGLIGKHVWYEESIGIPLAISGGGLEPRTISTVLGTPDMAPMRASLLTTRATTEVLTNVLPGETTTMWRPCSGT